MLGALLAALASQMGRGAPAANTVAAVSDPRTWVALAAAVSLAFATFFSQRLLGAEHVTAWARARAIAEALKRAAYKFAAGAAPYDEPDQAKRDALLEAERLKIEADGDDLLSQLVTTAGVGSVPVTPLSQADYVKLRVQAQIDWYKKRATEYATLSRRLRLIELTLAAAATLLTAAASVSNKLFGLPFDIAALTAVITTVGGAILAHVEAQRYAYLVLTYLATSRRLENRLNGPQAPWSDFVNACEDIMREENTSWVAKWSK